MYIFLWRIKTNILSLLLLLLLLLLLFITIIIVIIIIIIPLGLARPVELAKNAPDFNWVANTTD